MTAPFPQELWQPGAGCLGHLLLLPGHPGPGGQPATGKASNNQREKKKISFRFLFFGHRDVTSSIVK